MTMCLLCKIGWALIIAGVVVGAYAFYKQRQSE